MNRSAASAAQVRPQQRERLLGLKPKSRYRRQGACQGTKQKATRMGGFFFAADLSIQHFGDGPPLVLLHGGHGSWAHWMRNVSALASAHRVWVADLPGFGSSAVPPEPTLEGLLRALLAAIDMALGGETPFALAGFSFGGLIAAHVAARRPGVHRLALLGSGGHGSARRPRGALQDWRPAAGARDATVLHRIMRHNLLMHMLHDTSNLDDTALQVHTGACLRTRFRSKPISLAGGLQQCLDAYGGPVLLAWGENDVTATPTDAIETLSRGRHDCETLVVPSAGHWVQYESAEIVNRQLTRFLVQSPRS